MRWVTLTLAVLIMVLQYSLWFGRGSWFNVWQLQKQVDAQQQANQQAAERNAVMDAEVHDLKHGTAALEERARNDLGMVKKGEIFFQTPVQPASMPAASAVPAEPPGTPGTRSVSVDKGP